jgi:glycosyltransferase involved in cell wall biosynthesis
MSCYESRVRSHDLVSIVIPAFNAEEWISETLESVLRQTYENLELIIVDDGSTDRTLSVAETTLASSSLPRRLLRQQNKGASAARNNGWRSASGRWIQFLDADDLLAPTKIEIQVSSAGAQNADVIYSDWGRLVQRSGGWHRSEEIRAPFIGRNPLADILLDRNFQQLGSQLFNIRALQRVNGFDESCAIIEDVELCQRLAVGGAVFVKAKTDGPILWYRDRPRSLSKSSRKEFVDSCIRNAERAEGQLTGEPKRDEALIAAIVTVYFSAARYYAEHDVTRFNELVSDIMALCPKFLPPAPRRLRLLSRLIGYAKAERLAAAYRNLKRPVMARMRDHARSLI